jgi:single-strand DNA-binding protein
MTDLNRVYLKGNLVQDPELKDISNNNKVVNFVIASNRNWNGPEGQKNEEVSYIDCVAYGKRAETIDKYFSKGRKILVEGRLKQEKWVDKETQKNQSRIRVIVENFHFMDSKKEEGDACVATGAIPASAGNTCSNGQAGIDDSDFDAI